MKQENAAECAEQSYLITIGVNTPQGQRRNELRYPVRDAERVRELLTPRGYTPVLSSLWQSPTATEVRNRIKGWAASAGLGPKSVVVVYFAGHGFKGELHHELVCADEEGAESTLRTDDLCGPLLESRLGHLLVMLDTCYAGAGTAQLAEVSSRLASKRNRPSGVWLMASARGKEQAKERAFVDGLTNALTDTRMRLPQFLDVDEVTRRIQRYLGEHSPAQHVSVYTVDSDGHAPFFPNLPADGLDAAAVVRLYSRDRFHFEPRGRGIEHLGEQGDHFVGRTATLTELARWLAGPHDGRARVVTGAPGSGKSAVLGRLLLLSDEDYAARTDARPETLPPRGLTLVPLHARRATLERLVTDLAAVLGSPGLNRGELLEILGRRTTALVVVVDALDEAGTAGDSAEGARIARELLQPLSTLAGIRLIVGARRPLVPALGHATTVYDLDEHGSHFAADDVVAYARSLLLDSHEANSLSPYRDNPALADTVARGIAVRAGTCFLVARMTARALVQGQRTVDPARPGWQEELPSDVGQAFAEYLDRFGSQQAKVTHLLLPLAYAQGSGLPWSTLWSPLVRALTGTDCPHADLAWLHQNAWEYIIETEAPGGSRYRLYHETMAEYLRTPGGESAAHQIVADTLLTQVQPDPLNGRRAWSAAHPYIREHLADHAAAGGTLERLLHDNGYLVHAGSASLMRALRTAPPGLARTRGSVYRASADIHAGAPPEERQDILAIDAARFNQPRHVIDELSEGRPWRPLWATGSLVHTALRTTLQGRTGHAAQIACVTMDGRPHAVTTDSEPRNPTRSSRLFADGVLRVWDLTTGDQVASLTGHTGRISAVACYTFDGHAHAVTISPADLLGNGAGDGTVRVWDLNEGTGRVIASGDLGHGSLGHMSTMAYTMIDGQPHAVTGNQTGEAAVRVWNLLDGGLRGPLTGHVDAVSSIGCIDIEERPHAVVGCLNGAAWVYDLTDRTIRTVLTGHTQQVTAVACVSIAGVPHAITTSADKTVRRWNLDEGGAGTVLTGQTHAASALACTHIAKVPHAVTGGDDSLLRVWNLNSGTQRATLTGHTSSVWAVACISVDGRAHAVTGSGEPSARVWDLTEDTQARTVRRGHTRQVSGAAWTTVDGRPHWVTVGRDDVVRVWDAASGTQRVALTGHTAGSWGHPPSLDCTVIDGVPHAVTGGADYTVRVWDLSRKKERSVRTGHWNQVNTVVCTSIDGRPHAVSGSADWTVRVWDLTDDSRPEQIFEFGRPSRHEYDPGRDATAVICADLDARPHAVLAWGGDHNAVHIRDLTDGSPRGVLSCDMSGVVALATTRIAGRTHAVACGEGVEVWDLTQRTRRAVLTGHTGWVSAVACACIEGRPHAFTTGADRTIRVWDLETNELVSTIALPLPGHAISATPSDILVGMDDDIAVFTRHNEVTL
ncbi:hypothetical protein BN159_8478 [Streptomyces davaonensis JCM 4913]|uniref:Peptidase C14 caspase domain-containing protein n=1 Tax=Streptomyces davaonensis (strain DSM 101723 / JCM 4913 / KCC S-0913 / 768) TaxID=1214101 RepID=K4R9C3_STRDJ|nr:caspase family protein [Streptomyces davaonensis]CCK24406.1 hypothetical protein BN159_0027 [Streptomyces davaonensis JCM 4913]CCK32856.1 hypothetical protein BN159_8478 [Streptomyces davaonensis JCM 4913]